jgi:class 3 adenylate cyclase/predicted ATPase
MDDLRSWLERLDLGQYAQIFHDNDIDIQVLPLLSDNDLKELGLSLGHRRKFLTALSGKTIVTEIKAPNKPESSDTVSDAVNLADRRQLTVMFCDLVGSTALSQKLDPEELRELVSNYHNVVAQVITDHQGHVAQLLGDGVMAYFGWPHAHEDQVEMAVRAALAATKAVSCIEGPDKPLAARIGIATGQVVIGDLMRDTVQDRGVVSGETPNLAARLQSQAQPSEVIIDSTTRRLIGKSFVVSEDGGTHHLKGFNAPVKIWRVIRTANIGNRFDTSHDTELITLVGREPEMGLLCGRYRNAQEGEGQVVLISGEAGIGKSHILSAFNKRIKGDDCLTLKLQCSQHEINAAFQPILAEIELASYFQSDDSLEMRGSKLHDYLCSVFNVQDEAVSLIATLMSLSGGRHAPLDMAPQRIKRSTVAAFVERISLLSCRNPLVMVVEDVHWIDPSSLEVLDALMEKIQSLPVLMIMTHRPEFSTQWDNYGHVTMHSLNRLGHSDGRAISELVTGGKSLPDELQNRILQQTDGIPLFVEELTKTVLEAGILSEQEDCYVLDGPLPEIAIPMTLHDSLMARLDRMSHVKRVIQAAACIGREFKSSLLASALSMRTDALEIALEQLLEAQLIFRIGNAADQTYIFKHALVQDTAYSSLLIKSRKNLHQLIAKTLEQTENPNPLELARHFSSSGAYDRASSLYLMAGQQALESSALPEAIGALELGLQASGTMVPSKQRDRIELDTRVVLGIARMANFGWAHPSVAEALKPAFPLAKEFADPDALGPILWGLWVHFQTRTEFSHAHDWLSELKSVADAHKRSDLPLIYDMSAGCQHFWEAEYTEAINHTDHLKSIYDPKKHMQIVNLVNHDPLNFSQHWAGSLADWITGYPDSSVERMEEAVSHARKIAHPFNLVFALTAGATNLFYLDNVDRLLQHCDEAAKIVTEEALGLFPDHVCVMQWRGAALIMHDEFETGHALVKSGNDFWAMSGGKICTAMFRSWIALGLQGLGSINDATGLIAENITHCRQSGDRYMEPECIRIQGELMLKADKPDIKAAENIFKEAISIAKIHRAKSWELRAAMSLSRLLHIQDRRSDAVECLEPVLDWFTEGLETEDLRQANNLMTALS